MTDMSYTLQYIKTALQHDELPAPDYSRANGTSDALTGLYYAHQAGGPDSARKAWAMVQQQFPILRTLMEQEAALIHADELKNMSMPMYLMPEFPLYTEAFNVIVGASGGGKSFLALDIAGRIALDYPVVYIAGEGLSGYAARWESWKSYHQVQSSQLYFYREALQVLDNVQLGNFIELLRPHHPYLVIIDTLARSAVGVDENSAREMGQFISACDALRGSLDCGLIVVHHTGKSGDIRGSTALYGAADAVLSVAKMDGLVRVSNRSEHGGKNKYGEDKFESWFAIRPYETDGFNGAVLAPAERLQTEALEVNDNELVILTALSCHDEPVGVTELSSETKIKRATLYRNLKKLERRAMVIKEHNLFKIAEMGMDAVELYGGPDEHE